MRQESSRQNQTSSPSHLHQPPPPPQINIQQAHPLPLWIPKARIQRTEIAAVQERRDSECGAVQYSQRGEAKDDLGYTEGI